MVLENEILPYLVWLLGGDDTQGALVRYLFVALAVGLVGLVGGFIIAVARHGFLRGGDAVYRTVSGGMREMFQISPRRVWALSSLAMKEAWRRRVIVTLVVFLIILLFASWFLKTNNQDPAKLYISFVLTATTYLVLAIALLMSAFSLPNDFKTKTIYTIVTKPVRAGEIILGRIIGFTIVGTILLAIMGVCSYVFVVRSLAHTHTVPATSLRNAVGPTGEVSGYLGETSLDAYHRHEVGLDETKEGEAFLNYGHYHEVEPRGDELVVSAAQGYMRARVPTWGKLRFNDRQGVDVEHGISVGSEWTYRSFVDGNTQAAAIWTFDNADDLIEPEGLPLSLIVRVFKTHKGVIGQAITGSIQVHKPESDLRSEVIPFGAKDAKIDEITIPRKLKGASEGGTEHDLTDFISNDGKIEIWIQCLEGGQYFGFAQPDCYVRQADASPIVNYLKVNLSIWVQMVIVVAIGVTMSAVLSGPVAMLFTVSFILLGFFRETFVEIANGPQYGGGPLESLVRIITQKNMMVKLDPGFGTSLVENLDKFFQGIMWCISQVLPDFAAFSTVDFAAYGFDVPADRVLTDLTACLSYVAGLVVVGYFLFRTREVAK